jgi:hypothetical protein
MKRESEALQGTRQLPPRSGIVGNAAGIWGGGKHGKERILLSQGP